MPHDPQWASAGAALSQLLLRTGQAAMVAGRYAPGVCHLVGSRGAPPDQVPDMVVDGIKAREGRDGYVRLPRRPPKPRPVGIQPGDRVRVVAGPLFGHDGLVAGMASHQRVTVLLQALGRVTLSRGDVRAI